MIAARSWPRNVIELVTRAASAENERNVSRVVYSGPIRDLPIMAPSQLLRIFQRDTKPLTSFRKLISGQPRA